MRMLMSLVLFAAAIGCSPAPDADRSQVEAQAAAESGISIANPQIRLPLGGQSIAAGYMTIANRGASPDRLIAASSPAAQSIELHTHVEEGGMKSMVRIDSIEAPADGEVVLQPGGLHLMLFGFSAPASGDGVPITLTFERAGAVEAVLTPTAMPGGH
jgi:periplasmic copper chaperone A